MTAAALVLGDLNVDAVLAVPAYPAPGGDALATDSQLSAGGSAANTAMVLARLGLPTRLLARAGREAWGDLAINGLRAAGVDTVGVQRDAAAPTGLFLITVTPDGERTMFGLRGANTRLDPAGLDPALFAGAAWLHLSGYALLEAPQRLAAERALELARSAGVPASVDVGRAAALQAPDRIRGLLPQLALCVLDLPAAQGLVGGADPESAADRLAALGVGVAAVTLGADGCLLASGRERARQPAFAVPVIDTIGAGDAFSAGLIFGLQRGLGLAAAGQLANALGALAVGVRGAGPALPGRAEARAFLEGRSANPGLLAALAP